MNIIDIDFDPTIGGMVVCESHDGVYLAQFSIEHSDAVDVEVVVRLADESHLEYIDIDEYFSPDYVGGREIVQDSIVVSKIEQLILSHLEESRYDDSLDSNELVNLSIYKSNKNNSYKIACTEDEFTLKNFIFIKEIALIEKSIAASISKSINSVLTLYTKSTSHHEEMDVVRLAERIYEEASIAVGVSSLTISLDSLDIKKATDTYAELWMATEVISSINDCAMAILKEKISRLADEKYWIYKKTFSRKSFNLESFKSDHPDLYEKYSTTSDFSYFTKRRKSGEFPLSDSQIMHSMKAGLNLLSKQIKIKLSNTSKSSSTEV